MTSSSLSTYNSSLATDPLRSFRFNATFTAASTGDGVFDSRILSNGGTAVPTTGVSTGWVGGFTNISGLTINTQAIQYREGGYNTTIHQIPGMTTFSPLSFTRGVLYGNDQAMTWMRGLFAAAAGSGLNPSTKSGTAAVTPTSTGGFGGQGGFRVDILITVNEHPGTDVVNDAPQMAFKVHNAWISNLSYTDLDATNGAILFESMQLVHEGISVFFTNSSGYPTEAPTAAGLNDF